jgi:RHS repeat-associated protein
VYDGLGSVVGEVDPLGNLTCANEYDVYGAVRGRMGTSSTAHGFVGGLGHLSDASTGLIYMRARYYDPSTGRFASEDASANGNNWFEYCGNNPVDCTLRMRH